MKTDENNAVKRPHKKADRKRKRRAWAMIIIALLLIAIGFYFRSRHWPGGAELMMLFPLDITLIIAGITRLLLRQYGAALHSDSNFKVDYRVRYALNRCMKTKRKQAWVQLVLIPHVLILLCVILLIYFGDILVIVVAVAVAAWLMLTNIQTIRISRQLEVAMRKNNQADFEVAMKKWSWRCWAAAFNMVLIMLIMLIIVIITTFTISNNGI